MLYSRDAPPQSGFFYAPSPNKQWETKSLEASLQADNNSGHFAGYASVFGVMDLARDVVMPGAFRFSLHDRGAKGVKLLWQHDPTEIIGQWQRIEEDKHGLYVEGQLDMRQNRGREALRLMQKGALDGLSIGYRVDAERKDLATGMRRLDKIDLWEISLVTFPLLPQARVQKY